MIALVGAVALGNLGLYYLSALALFVGLWLAVIFTVWVHLDRRSELSL